MTNGTAEWIEGRFAATGNGDMFAYALLYKYAGTTLGREQAQLLAYKVIEEAIHVGAYGLGPPIDIWEVGQNGTSQATEAEISALEDAARQLRALEVEMLAGGFHGHISTAAQATELELTHQSFSHPENPEQSPVPGAR